MTSPQPAPRALIPIAKPLIGEDERAAVMQVLESGQLAQGPRVAEFEAAFAAHVGAPYAVAVNSGTAALIVALQGRGIGPGDEVITTPFSFIATATSIIACGATPVFVDIDPFDFNLDPALVEDAITDETKAVMPVHLYGNPARLGELRSICDDFELELIEDAAQAHGALYEGHAIGATGTACFSFYPTKNMTTGEGGILTTDDAEFAERCRIIRNHGQGERYLHTMFGLNWRMQDINAAIGLVQLGHVEEWTRRRIGNAERLSSLLTHVETPRVREGSRHVFHQYTVRVSHDRDRLQEELRAAGVGSAVHYPIPLHQQPIMKELGFGEGSFPLAEAAAASVLSLPVHPSLTDEEVSYIAETVNRLTG
ncbi:MAG TPA: DegT/DnrJ/EryC1/StrS family aminotransferase [Tepidiformaceae bacterium]|nr:DegT/DnrJ/EryC1/StrS family aminotransferase [Tepidiformaceae bacterium]